MAMCPHCKKVITTLKYAANFSETNYGRTWGTADLDGDNCETDDSESRDADNYEESDYEYFCPLCEHTIDDLSVLKDTGLNKLGAFPKKRGAKRAVETERRAL